MTDENKTHILGHIINYGTHTESVCADGPAFLYYLSHLENLADFLDEKLRRRCAGD